MLHTLQLATFCQKTGYMTPFFLIFVGKRKIFTTSK